MQHMESVWKTRAAALLALGLASLPLAAHAESDSGMRVERTSSFDVALTIGPAQTMAPHSADMGMSHDMSMGANDMTMQPQPADEGMAVNHWLDLHVTPAGSDSTVSAVSPTIRILDKSTGEARDLPNVMAMSGGMSSNDVHFGQNVFLPDGTYQITVLLGPADTAQFRDVTVSAAMMAPAMSSTMADGHDMSTNTMPGAQP